MNRKIIVISILLSFTTLLHSAAQPLAIATETPEALLADHGRLMTSLRPELKSIILAYLPFEHQWHVGNSQSHVLSSTANPLGDYRYCPNGFHVAFVEKSIYNNYHIVVMNTKTQDRVFTKKILIDEDPTHPLHDSRRYSEFSWSSEGNRLAYRDGALIVVVNPLSGSHDVLFSAEGSSASWSCTDNNVLAITGYSLDILIYDISTGRVVHTIRKVDQKPRTFKTLLWHPTSNLIATLSRGGTAQQADVSVYEVSTARRLYNMTRRFFNTHRVYYDAAFSPDGLSLVVSSGAGVVMYESLTGKKQRTIPLTITARHLLTWLGNTTLCLQHLPAQDARATIINTENGTPLGIIPYKPFSGYLPGPFSYCKKSNRLIDSVQSHAGTKTLFRAWQPTLAALCSFTSKTSRLPLCADKACAHSSSYSTFKAVAAPLSPDSAPPLALEEPEVPLSQESKETKDQAKK